MNWQGRLRGYGYGLVRTLIDKAESGSTVQSVKSVGEVAGATIIADMEGKKLHFSMHTIC